MPLLFLFLVLFLPSVSLADPLGITFSPPAESPPVISQRGNVVDVYIPEMIYSPNKFLVLFAVLDGLTSSNTVYVHLNGPGGDASAAVQIIFHIKNTKAKTIAVIEGQVASAHAMIAMSTNEIIIGKNTSFVFHTVSSWNSEGEYCGDVKGRKDRGQDAYKKCLQNLKFDNIMYDKILLDLIDKSLTKSEIKQIHDGFEVSISGEDMARKIKNKKVTLINR